MNILERALPYLVVLALVLALVLAALFGAYSHGVTVADAEWATKWNNQAAELAEVRAQAERIQRDEEQRRQTAINEVTDHAQKQIQQAAADAAAATAAADSMRKQAQRLAARASQACGNTGAADSGQAVSAPGLVLADVLARADEAAGELAAAYDRARAAGAACERAYNAVRGE